MLRTAIVSFLVGLVAAQMAPPAVVSFESGDFGYKLSVVPPAEATADFKSAAAASDGKVGVAVVVATAGPTTSYVELGSPMYTFEAGKTYTIKLQARAVGVKPYITIAVKGGSGSKKVSGDFGLSAQFSTYQIAKYTPKENLTAKVVIGCGTVGTYHIDNIQIRIEEKKAEVESKETATEIEKEPKPEIKKEAKKETDKETKTQTKKKTEETDDTKAPAPAKKEEAVALGDSDASKAPTPAPAKEKKSTKPSLQKMARVPLLKASSTDTLTEDFETLGAYNVSVGVNKGANATVDFESGMSAAKGMYGLRVTVDKKAKAPWDIQVLTRDQVLLPSREYTFSFWGKAAEETSVPVMALSRDDFSVAFKSDVTFTTEWTELTLVGSVGKEGPYYFNIQYGLLPGTYMQDEFSLTSVPAPAKTDSAVGLGSSP